MPRPGPEQAKALLKVSKVKAEVTAEKMGLRAHYENLRREAEKSLDLRLDQAVREAADTDCKIAWIKGALGTQDFATVKRMLDRTPSLKSIQAEAVANGAYSLRNDGGVTVTYLKHGPAKLNGTAEFNVVDLDGTPMFVALEQSADRAEPEIIKVIDGVLEGFYYDELVKWYKSQTSLA